MVGFRSVRRGQGRLPLPSFGLDDPNMKQSYDIIITEG